MHKNDTVYMHMYAYWGKDHTWFNRATIKTKQQKKQRKSLFNVLHSSFPPIMIFLYQVSFVP